MADSTEIYGIDDVSFIQNKIAFCIVVYGEEYVGTAAYQSLVQSIEYSLLTSVDIFIFDNSEMEQRGNANFVLENGAKVNYSHNPGNPGLSFAYNAVAKQAFETGNNWLVLLDQDTKLPPSAVNWYVVAVNKFPKVYIKAPVIYVNDAIFSPSREFLKKTVAIASIRPGIFPLAKFNLINSGLLIKLSLFFEVGGYNERIKIDFADYEFLRRVKQNTREFEVLPFCCGHDFSHNEKNINKAIKRYTIFLSDLSQCTRNGFIDYFGFTILDVTHLLKLTFKFRSGEFLKQYIKFKFGR